MKSRIYVETSVVSFYHDVRTEPEMIARRDWTRRFWDFAKDEYTLLSSPAVIEELEQGDFLNQQAMLDLVDTLTVLPIDEMVGLIVEHGNAKRSERRCPAFSARVVSQMRFSADVELQTPR